MVFAVILVFHHLFHYTQTLTEIHPTVKTGDFFRRRVKSQHEQRLDWAGRNVFTYSGEITGTPNGDAPSILNTSYNFKAEVEVPTGGGEIIKFRSVLMASLIS